MSGNNEGQHVIYGSYNCGWCKKQLQLLKEKGLVLDQDFKFIDCDENDCPSVDGYPQHKTKNNKIIKGFSDDLNKLELI